MKATHPQSDEGAHLDYPCISCDGPPILQAQRCKVCGKDSISEVCDSASCQIEFYSAEWQEWPDDFDEWTEDEYDGE